MSENLEEEKRKKEDAEYRGERRPSYSRNCPKDERHVFNGPLDVEPERFIESSWEEVLDNFDDIKLEEELPREVNDAHCFEEPSTIQQGAIVSCVKEHKTIVGAQSGAESKMKNKTKKDSAGKHDFETLYDQITGENQVLVANKSFWTRKGNSQKYICTLCNRGVQVSSNLSAFKSAVVAHVEDKYHKKRYDSFVAKKSLLASPKNVIPTEKQKQVDTFGNGISVLDMLQQDEEALLGDMEGSDKDDKNWRDKSNVNLLDFDSIYDSFEKSNPVIKTSKQFITKTEDGRHFFCNLCKVLVFNSLNATEFRYNLFVHLNEEGHREKLPNFSVIKKSFNKVMSDLSTALPNSYKDEIKYFEIGPVFRYVKCTLCDEAVSVNLHRLENHLKGNQHSEKKQRAIKGQSLQTEPLNKRTRNAFRRLVVQLDDQFKKDVKYIHIGKIPGYVLCSLCSYVVLPTKFYIETHLETPVHAKNKSTNVVNRKSKMKIDLKDLMKTLPSDLKDYNIFEETPYGLTCKRCDVTIPPTSYDLYTHITKERLVSVTM